MAEEGLQGRLPERKRRSLQRGDIGRAPTWWGATFGSPTSPSSAARREKAYLSPVIDCTTASSWRGVIGRRPNAALANGSWRTRGTLSQAQRPVCHSDRGAITGGPAGSAYARGTAGPVHVEEGLQPGQRGLRGLLRPPEERVLHYRDWAASPVDSFMEMLNESHRLLQRARKKQSLGWMGPGSISQARDWPLRPVQGIVRIPIWSNLRTKSIFVPACSETSSTLRPIAPRPRSPRPTASPRRLSPPPHL